MSNKLKRLNLVIDEESYKKAHWLKEKQHINISSLCREAIMNIYKQLKSLFRFL